MKYKGKIYISGPVSDMDFGEAKKRFLKAREIIREAGYVSCNPLNQFYLNRWQDNIIRDLMLLAECDGICLLTGWSRSYGSRIERLFAEKLGLRVYQIENDKLTEVRQ